MFEGLAILYVEDDDAIRPSVSQSLELAGFAVKAYRSAEEAWTQFTAQPSSQFNGIVISDVQLPKMSGLDLLGEVINRDKDCPVILVTGHGDVEMAVQAMRAGAYDFIEKPFTPERLIEVATRALETRSLKLTIDNLRTQLKKQNGIEAVLLGHSRPIQLVRQQIIQLASMPTDVMIMGETGTGKELVARCLHDYGTRQSKNFVAINCGGIPDTLLESELFGHEAGAFTNASKRRIGKIEHANQGTLFLDEIESMPLSVQVKFLRVLQERCVERLGSNDLIPIDMRVIAATKNDLLALSGQKKFRSDLYYRLNVAVIQLPALRDRRTDIPLLFEAFVLQAATKLNREPPSITNQHLYALMAHDWPGNVRELRNMAERFVLGLCGAGGGGFTPQESPPLTLAQQIEMVEKNLIEQTLKQYHGKTQKTYEALGIAKKTLYDKIHKYAINIDDYRSMTNDDDCTE